MATHSQTEIQAAWIAHGVSPANARIASAISMAESGGRDEADNEAGDLGYMQIEIAAHPDVSAACAHNFACATTKAVQISKGGTDFTPWTTYTKKTYLSFLGNAAHTSPVGTAATGDPATTADASISPFLPFPFNAIPGVPGPKINVPGVSNPLDGLKALAAFFSKALTLFYPATWLRIGKIVLGFSLILYGLNALFKSSFGVSPADKVVGGAKKAGEVAATVAVVK